VAKNTTEEVPEVVELDRILADADPRENADELIPQ